MPKMMFCDFCEEEGVLPDIKTHTRTVSTTRILFHFDDHLMCYRCANKHYTTKKMTKKEEKRGALRGDY
jgi:hypothetical protein